eukprot:833124-Pleurochrysis_carterae.AAC.2
MHTNGSPSQRQSRRDAQRGQTQCDIVLRTELLACGGATSNGPGCQCDRNLLYLYSIQHRYPYYCNIALQRYRYYCTRFVRSPINSKLEAIVVNKEDWNGAKRKGEQGVQRTPLGTRNNSGRGAETGSGGELVLKGHSCGPGALCIDRPFQQ